MPNGQYEKGEYEKALRESSYKNGSLNYADKSDIKQKQNRARNIIWFNPLSNKNISTNVDKQFMNLIDQHFPKFNKLHAIFNRNIVSMVKFHVEHNKISQQKSYQ